MTIITEDVSRPKGQKTGKKSAAYPACETCRYLSDGFRCQRITSAQYSRFIEAPNLTFCPRYERYGWSIRVRDG